MRDVLELHEFFIEGRDQKTSHVLLHITEPTTPEEQAKGYFFAVAEIEQGTTQQIEHVQKMIDDLESGYYETEDEDDKSGFELTLEYINRRGHHILGTNKMQLHCLVGTIRNGNIAFAYHGDPEARVVFQGKQGYRTLSIIDHDEELPEGQMFSALMQGSIQSDDFFYIATPHVGDYVAPDRLQKIITSRTTRQSVQHMQKMLSNLGAEESFGGILFHLLPKAKMPKTGKMPAHLKQGSEDSLNKLMSAQRSTRETLHPPMLGKAGSSLKSIFRMNSDRAATPLPTKPKRRSRVTATAPVETAQPSEETNHRTRQPQAPKEPLARSFLVGLGKALVFLGALLLRILQQIFHILRQIIVGLIVFITNNGGGREQIIRNTKDAIRRRKEALQRLPLMSKVLFAATVIFALIFVGSIVVLRVKEANQVKQQAFDNLIAAIQDKKDAADAGLIYGDDARAFDLLKEAEALVDELAEHSKEGAVQAEQLSAELESTLIKLRRIETVDAQILVDLFATNEQAAISELVQIENQLIAFGPADTNLYGVDIQTGSVETQPHTVLPTLLSASTPKEDDFTIFLTSPTEIAELDKETLTLSTKDISFPSSDAELADLFVYNRRVYSVDVVGGQIYKHNPTQTGYDRGAPWLSESADLAGATSIAIDGDIFVLKNSGEILKFDAGKLSSFEPSGLDPVLAAPTQLWTYNDVEEIYILEPTARRIVVLNKDGRLLKQYTSPLWQNPAAMVIDAEEGNGYVLDGTIVYRFSL